jgi:peptidoglycan hydrolase CwlO-like protein
MTTDQKLDQMLTLLTGFITKQEAFNENQQTFNENQQTFNENQQTFNENQQTFNENQLSFNDKTTANFARLDRKIDQMYDEFLSFQKNEEIQHGVTHKLIMQAFAHITELQSKQPWQA